MEPRRRTLLDAALDSDSLVGRVVEDARRSARRHVVDEVLGGALRERIDAVLERMRRRP